MLLELAGLIQIKRVGASVGRSVSGDTGITAGDSLPEKNKDEYFM